MTMRESPVEVRLLDTHRSASALLVYYTPTPTPTHLCVFVFLSFAVRTHVKKLVSHSKSTRLCLR